MSGDRKETGRSASADPAMLLLDEASSEADMRRRLLASTPHDPATLVFDEGYSDEISGSISPGPGRASNPGPLRLRIGEADSGAVEARTVQIRPSEMPGNSGDHPSTGGLLGNLRKRLKTTDIPEDLPSPRTSPPRPAPVRAGESASAEVPRKPAWTLSVEPPSGKQGPPANVRNPAPRPVEDSLSDALDGPTPALKGPWTNEKPAWKEEPSAPSSRANRPAPPAQVPAEVTPEVVAPKDNRPWWAQLPEEPKNQRAESDSLPPFGPEARGRPSLGMTGSGLAEELESRPVLEVEEPLLKTLDEPMGGRAPQGPTPFDTEEAPRSRLEEARPGKAVAQLDEIDAPRSKNPAIFLAAAAGLVVMLGAAWMLNVGGLNGKLSGNRASPTSEAVSAAPAAAEGGLPTETKPAGADANQAPTQGSIDPAAAPPVAPKREGLAGFWDQLVEGIVRVVSGEGKAKPARVVGPTPIEVEPEADEEPAVAELAAAEPGILLIEVPNSAHLFIDDKDMGVEDDLYRMELPPGVYEVRAEPVTSEGHTWRAQARVDAGMVRKLRLDVMEEPEPPLKRREKRRRGGR